MADDLQEFKKEIGVKWIRAESGTSYLCPLASFARLGGSPKEDDLKRICVDESQNPQNE